MQTFHITIAYNVSHSREVTVRASTVARACQRAIEIGDGSPEGWLSSDYESPTYVEEIDAGGEHLSVPANYTEAGIIAPEISDLRRGLEQVIGIGESESAAQKPEQALQLMVAHAWAALAKAQPLINVELAGGPHPARCKICGGRGRLNNPGDYLGTETCPGCAGTGRARMECR